MGNHYMENNWKHKTIEQLEKSEWPDFDSDSRLIRRTKELRRIPLNEFTTEDLRLMIGQQVGLDYLIPLAIETLRKNLFAEGDFFEGDLLKNVLGVKTEFWNINNSHWSELLKLIEPKRNEIAQHKFSLLNFDNSIHTV